MVEGASHDDRSSLHRNPFHLLGATLDSTRRDIAQLAEQKALLLPEDEVRRARAELTQPNRRLAAEVAWLPGASPDVVKQLVDYDRLDSDILRFAQVPALTQANAYAAMFEERLTRGNVADWAPYDLPALLPIIDRIDAAEVAALLNEHRGRSGFPEVNVPQVREALNGQRRYYLAVCRHVLDQLGLVSRRAVLLEALDTSGPDAHVGHDLIDAYELERSADIEKQLRSLDALVERIRRDPAPKGAPLFQFKNQLPPYARLVEPILRSKGMRGLAYRPTEELVWKYRAAAIDIANDQNAFQTSWEIATAIRDAFSVSPSIQNIVANDIEQLEEILREVGSAQAAHQSVPQVAEQPGRSRQPVPAVPLSPTTETRKGGVWKVVAAIVVLIFIANMLTSDEEKPGTNSLNFGGDPPTSTRDQCEGVGEWWDETNGRVDEAYAAMNRLTSHSSQPERTAVVLELRALAREQRLSNPPRAAQAYSRATAAEFELIADSLTDNSRSSEWWAQEFDKNQADVRREGNAVGAACDFQITWEDSSSQ